MPHARPGKEWLHLRDRICLGDVQIISDVLTKEHIAVDHLELEIALHDLKRGGTDACAVVDEETFKDSVHELINQGTSLNPASRWSIKRWGEVFDAMVRQASGRIAAGPSHYTEKTPEGALESMERRLAEVLAQMDLRVGELAEAVRQMGVAGVSQETVEKIDDLVTTIEDVVEEVTVKEPRPTSKQGIVLAYLRTLTPRQLTETGAAQVAALLTRLNPTMETFTSGNVSDVYFRYPRLTHKDGIPRLTGHGPAPDPSMPLPRAGSKARIVADYLINLGEDIATTDIEKLLADLREQNPTMTFLQADYYATVSPTRFPNLPRLGQRVGGTAGPPAPTVILAQPPEGGGELGDIIGRQPRISRMLKDPPNRVRTNLWF